MITNNNVIRELRLLRRRHWSTWVTVWPFVVLYAVSIMLYMDPELVWDRMTYLVHSTYIDFFHAICAPVVLFLHGFLSLFTIWSVRFRAVILFRSVTQEHMESATHVLVCTREHQGESEIVPLIQFTDEYPTYFVFQERKWKLDAKTGRFVKPIFPVKELLPHYLDWQGLSDPTMCEKQLDSFGPNKMEVVIPDFQTLLVDHALAPFFVFQMFCVLLWCLDEYWYYSLFTGVMMVGMECTVVMQRIRNMKTLRDMAEVPVREVTVVRQGQEKRIKTNELLPMDLMVVESNAPCPVDSIIVRGTCIVNEATLTGESTPQLKEAPDWIEIPLDMKKHGRHLLFSGTELLLSNGPYGKSDTERGMALAVVLKTGFETKQGQLLRTILHSQGRVSENSGESFAFIGVLVVFALAAAGYLLKRGLEDPNRSRWKLFLSCVQIITAVVPPELPMELSLAVNTSLLSLVRLQVFCTEPFRIPFAGKVDTCCFDKTGTLTTDEMLFGGVDMADGNGLLNQLKKIPKLAEVVLVTCHSLLQLEGVDTVAGDAMEKAALGALGYRVNLDDTIVYDPPLPKDSGAVEGEGKNCGAGKSKKAKKNNIDANKQYMILSRFPFSANLRRMSCVVNTPEGKYVVAKGSPEAIAHLCKSVPPEYHQVADTHASRGYRVIALAARPLREEERSKTAIHHLQREDCEKDLIFAGLAVYECPLKKDAKDTISVLQNGSHRCVIITGDSVRTAISVGQDVGILRCRRQLVARGAKCGSGAIEWCDASTGELITLDQSAILRKTFVHTRKHTTPTEEEWDLCVNAENLSPASMTTLIAACNEHIAVWARCAPTQKEDIVTDLKKKDHLVLMAGDGTNDVGALKQAHAGVAVLNAAAVAPQKSDGKIVDNSPQSHNEPDVPPEHKLPPGFKFTVLPPKPSEDAPFMVQMRWKMAEARRKAEIFQIGKWNKQIEEMKQKKLADKAAMPPPPDSSTSDFLMQSLFNEDEMDFGGPPQIKLGDASIAAPFTCRSKALMSVCDIVRLGRSTLVTTLQMYKILALNCLTSAYSMSVLHTDGVKLGEKQMVLSGVILSVCFLCMSRSQPMPTLCPQRPITRVFHPYMICTIFMQFGLHLYSMMQTVKLVEEVDSTEVANMRQSGFEGEFKPTLLNSAMFLLTTLIGGVTFAVNYRGEPFMQSLRRNKPLFYALIFLSLVVIYFASEADPEGNAMFEFVAFPSDEFRRRFIQLLLTDAGGCFAIEYACLYFLTDYL
ncbi:putative cation transporting ATPase [Trypanosoma rangeli]|uniref:Putative cation transporting ATPase n=1 Tax=Trypanosoma rangeli TaxID=5698 RepID=A0A3R7N8T2_TRYRA|nr:putative cation transporting ATPase [Trypanosoma rangeli]RNF02300.1 putative cation transporting ATPase [Trypanosoma rangeli]|eukprot:RNF02300.1 putative cation transporting ATPase [Trypanosoma rangeli]